MPVTANVFVVVNPLIVVFVTLNTFVVLLKVKLELAPKYGLSLN